MQWDCADICLKSQYTITCVIEQLGVNPFVELFMEGQSVDFASISNPFCKINAVVLASDLILFDHLVWTAVDYEYTTTYSSRSNAVLILNHQCSYVNLLFVCSLDLL